MARVTGRFLVLVALATALPEGGAASAQKVRVGLGYLPDVQFAPFYLAAKNGLYARRGLEVEFTHGFAQELYPLLAAGKLDFVVGDAEDVISLRAGDEKSSPFKYVMAMYQSVSNALFSRPEKGIRTIKDLKGKRVGMPALAGSSYTALQAILRAAGLGEKDLTIETIGFTQLEAVLANRVDVAMGFVNNEPVVLRSRGVPVSVIRASLYDASAGNGVITTDATLAGRADLVRRFLGASQDALAATLEDPKAAFAASKPFVPGLGEDRLAVLQASLPLYQSSTSRKLGLGFSSPSGWERTLALLRSVGRLKTSLPASAFFTNAYLRPGVQPKR